MDEVVCRWRTPSIHKLIPGWAKLSKDENWQGCGSSKIIGNSTTPRVIGHATTLRQGWGRCMELIKVTKHAQREGVP